MRMHRLIIIISSIIMLAAVGILSVIFAYCLQESQTAYDLQWSQTTPAARAYIEYYDGTAPGRTYHIELIGQQLNVELYHGASAAGMKSHMTSSRAELTPEIIDKIWLILNHYKAKFSSGHPDYAFYHDLEDGFYGEFALSAPALEFLLMYLDDYAEGNYSEKELGDKLDILLREYKISQLFS